MIYCTKLNSNIFTIAISRIAKLSTNCRSFLKFHWCRWIANRRWITKFTGYGDWDALSTFAMEIHDDQDGGTLNIRVLRKRKKIGNILHTIDPKRRGILRPRANRGSPSGLSSKDFQLGEGTIIITEKWWNWSNLAMATWILTRSNRFWNSFYTTLSFAASVLPIVDWVFLRRSGIPSIARKRAATALFIGDRNSKRTGFLLEAYQKIWWICSTSPFLWCGAYTSTK